MSEGGANTKMKRNGARIFKNPPQPHMCIQDFEQRTTNMCYVNVLSWDKIAMPHNPSQPVPLYGGMKVNPPREQKNVSVYAVMVNPEVLRIQGKNAEDPEKRSTLIEVLLDFVETMNEGIVFSRHYTVLKDRDITGELKEVWTAVQAKKDKEASVSQQETWIDAQPPVPQYPQYDQQQQQQKQRQLQDYPSPLPQIIPHHPNINYGRVPGTECSNYEREVCFSYPTPIPIVDQNGDMIYESNPVKSQIFHNNGQRMVQDRFSYREPGQQNCPAYPAPHYQLQQLPRQMMPQYVNSNVGPNYALSASPNVNLNMANHFPDYMGMSQYMMEQHQIENTMHADVLLLPQQQQQSLPQLQPVPQYDLSSRFDALHAVPMRPGKPYMGMVQKNNVTKKQGNSPTHTNKVVGAQTKDMENNAKGTSPVKLLQRENAQSPQEKKNEDKVQVTDLDEDLVLVDVRTRKITSKQTQPLDYAAALTKNDKVLSHNQENTNFSKLAMRWIEYKKNDLAVERLSIHEKQEKEEPTVSNPESLVGMNGFVNKQKATESSKRFTQTTVHNIIKNVFKLPSTSRDDGTELFVRSMSRKSNGQIKSGSTASSGSSEQEAGSQGYTILRKPEATQENDVAQVPTTIQDCKDASELSAVIS